MNRPRIKLIYPDGSTEWYKDCAIEDSLLPDLSFIGVRVDSGDREKVVTNLAYKIVVDPPVPQEPDLEGTASRLSSFFGVPWRDTRGEMHDPPEKTA